MAVGSLSHPAGRMRECHGRVAVSRDERYEAVSFYLDRPKRHAEAFAESADEMRGIDTTFDGRRDDQSVRPLQQILGKLQPDHPVRAGWRFSDCSLEPTHTAEIAVHPLCLMQDERPV